MGLTREVQNRKVFVSSLVEESLHEGLVVNMSAGLAGCCRRPAISEHDEPRPERNLKPICRTRPELQSW